MKRMVIVVLIGAALAACAAPAPRHITARALAAADAATSLIVGEHITLERSAPAAAPADHDPAIFLTVRHADGRVMRFQEGNHTPYDVMAQAPGGSLAQSMGLFGEEAPTLYNATGAAEAPFICGPQGPRALGVYDGPDGVTQIVGLSQTFQFETRPDGAYEAVPYSPDQVCARLRFRAG